MARRILVIDDSEDICSFLSMILHREGCEVRTVENRGDALAISVSDWSPDIILLDYNMPGMTVDEFLKQLVRGRSAKLPRVVLMTAGHEADQKARQIGIPEVLHKPFEPHDVLESIAPCSA